MTNREHGVHSEGKRDSTPRSEWPVIRWVLALAITGLLPISGQAEETSDPSSTAGDKPAATVDASSADVPSEKTSETESTKPASPKARLNARLRLEYDYREQGSATDSDFYGRLYGSGRDLWRGKLDLYFSARVHTDLDDSSSSSLADDPYRGVDDSNGVTDDRVLQLYGDVHNTSRNIALRAGRQYVDIADYLQMDGGQFMLNENGNLGGRAYFGHPVSYYSSVSGDYAGGLSLVGRPWEGNQSRLTLGHYYDDSQDADDQNYFVDIRQKWTETLNFRGRFSILNDEFRMAQADMFYYAEDGETDFSAGCSYWGQFDANTRAYSPLYNVLGEQDPYTYAYARLTQQIIPKWIISPGVSLRFAEQEENAHNNRDYENYDLTLIYEPNRSFNTSLSVEYWVVEPNDSFLGLSGDLRYRHGRIWEISGGVSYAQYTYDTYSDLSYTVNGGQTVFSENGTVIEESPYVKTYFVRAKWRIIKNLTMRLQFDIEDDDKASDLAYRGRGSIEVRY